MLSESFDFWGLPIEEKEKPLSVHRPKNVQAIWNKKIIHEAESFLSLHENRVTSLMMEAHVSMDYVGQEDGSITYKAKVTLDMKPYVDAATKKAEQEFKDADEHEAAVEDYLSDMLSSYQIEKKLEDGIWQVIRHQGKYTGIKVDANMPSASNLKDIETLEFEIKIFASPEVNVGDIEKEVQEIVSGLEI